MTESKLAKAPTKLAAAITKQVYYRRFWITDGAILFSVHISEAMIDGKLSRVTRRSSSPTFYCLHIHVGLITL